MLYRIICVVTRCWVQDPSPCHNNHVNEIQVMPNYYTRSIRKHTRLFTVPYFFVRSFLYRVLFSNVPRGRASGIIAVGGGGGDELFICILSKIAILDKMKWNSKPPSPPNQGWSRAKGKSVPFSRPWFRGGGGARFSIYFVQDCNLGQKKMEQQTPIPPPPPQIKDEAARRAKMRLFSILDLGGEGRGGLGFPFILFKIAAKS